MNAETEPAAHESFPDRVARIAREIVERQQQGAQQRQAEHAAAKAEVARQRQEREEAHGNRAIAAGFLQMHLEGRQREQREVEQRRRVPDADDAGAALDRATADATSAHHRHRRAEAEHNQASQKVSHAGAVVADQLEKISKLRAWHGALLEGEAARILDGLQPEADPLLAERKIADAERHLAVYEKAQHEAAEVEVKARVALEAAKRDAGDAQRRLAHALFTSEAGNAVRQLFDALRPLMAEAEAAGIAAGAAETLAGWFGDRNWREV